LSASPAAASGLPDTAVDLAELLSRAVVQLDAMTHLMTRFTLRCFPSTMAYLGFQSRRALIGANEPRRSSMW